MKMRISIIALLTITILANVGCATHDLAYERSRFRNPNRNAVAMSTTVRQERDSKQLPAIAEAPQGTASGVSWGGSLSPRY